MTKWIRCLTVFLAALLITGVVSAETLKVGSDITFPPFEYIDPSTGEPTGFDIELIKAIGATMNVDVEIVHSPWDNIFNRLFDGEFDVIISALSITEARAEVMELSEPYFITGQVIVARADDPSIRGPEDLIGKKVAVRSGTTSVDAAVALALDRIVYFDEWSDVFTALESGEVDAALSDEIYAASEVQRRPDQFRLAGDRVTAEPYGIAARKGETELIQKINEALAALRADGTHQALYEKWIGAIEP